jgi:gluconolactonase
MAGACAVAPAWAAAAPAPATIRILSPRGAAIIDPHAVVETIATGIKWAEGPVWSPRAKALFFSDPPANIMRRWSWSGGVTMFLQPSGAATFDPKLVREAGSNGLALAADGALLIADSGSRAVVRLDLGTKKRTVLVDRYRGKRFSSPNDLHVARSGAIYFTDPPYGFVDGDASSLKELEQNGVYRWTPGGEAVLVDGTLTRPNGVALSPDERRLYVSVSDEKAPRIMVYDLDAKGMPRNSRVFLDGSTLHGPGLPDGMKVAADGTLFCSAPGGMYLLSPEAEPLALIANGGPIANCAFGEDGATLFLTANDRVLRVRLRHSGRR